MKTANRKYKGLWIFACNIQENLTSIHAQYDTAATVSRDDYKELILRTNNLEGAIDIYIKMLDKGELKI